MVRERSVRGTRRHRPGLQTRRLLSFAIRNGPEGLEERLLLTADLPRYDHIVVVIEENHSKTNILGNPDAPYMNSLASLGTSFTNMYALTHPSQPNYFNIFSGSTQGAISNAVPMTPSGELTTATPFSTPNLAAELRNAGFSFASYADGLPEVGSQEPAYVDYQRKHNPIVNWQDNSWIDDAHPPAIALPNSVPQSLNLPFTSFPASAAGFASLPTISFIVPDQRHDMHDGTIAEADIWLQQNIDPYYQWAKSHDSLLIVTWDEDDFVSNNIIPTIIVGPGVKTVSNDVYHDHFDLLRTLEDMYDLRTSPANAGNLTPVSAAHRINDIWIDAPVQLTATVRSSTRIDLVWQDNCQGETGFSIERSTNNGPFAQIGTAEENQTAYTDQSAQPDTGYSYRVRAIRTPGPYSNSSNVATTAAALPSVPGNLTAVAAAGTTITLNWIDLSINENGFRIERATNGGPFVGIGLAGRDATTFNDHNGVEGAAYVYRVRSYNGIGASIDGAIASVNLASAPPTAAMVSPFDNGEDDYDPAVGLLTVGTASELIVQLSDVGSGIADASVSSGAVALSRDDVPLTIGADYTYSYDSIYDRITLRPLSPSFPRGTYRLIVSSNNQILDLAGNSMPATPFQIVVNADNNSAALVTGRYVFYNQSKFDGNNAAANAADDLAIATDKTALLPGGTASFANYTSYNSGLNGLMVDIAGLQPAIALVAADFEFKVGNSSTPSAWTPMSTAPLVSNRPGAGLGGSLRVTLTWPTGAALKQWLQVTIKPTENTRLAAPDVFYFGSAVGESGNVPGDYSVSLSDELLARNNPVTIVPGTLVTNRFDFNRDGTVSVIDQLLSRNNITTAVTKLKQINVPGALLSAGLKAQALDDSADSMPRPPAEKLVSPWLDSMVQTDNAATSLQSDRRLSEQRLLAIDDAMQNLPSRRTIRQPTDISNDVLESLLAANKSRNGSI